jgi:hypothetical protein
MMVDATFACGVSEFVDAIQPARHRALRNGPESVLVSSASMQPDISYSALDAKQLCPQDIPEAQCRIFKSEPSDQPRSPPR